MTFLRFLTSIVLPSGCPPTNLEIFVFTIYDIFLGQMIEMLHETTQKFEHLDTKTLTVKFEHEIWA